jgi:uncharacterized membrane protein YbhN (UPF0104 family)
MHPRVRFLVGVLLGGGALLVYAAVVGVEDILARVAGLEPAVLGLLLVLVVAEGAVDGIGVWASVRPLGEGLTGPRSVQFALAGDFFDVVSPAGAVTSEPIMAQFIGVATETTYSDALGVRGVAKYVKAGGQLLLSGAVGVAILAGDPAASTVLVTIGAAVAVVAALGLAVLVFRRPLTLLATAVLTPIAARVSALYREDPHDRAWVEAALERFATRVAAFRSHPRLLALIVLGGVLEQVLVALALWVLLGALGTSAAVLALLVIVPLPQAGTVVPVPASLGSYDALLGGGIVLTTGVPLAAAATAVLVFRTTTIAFSVAAGGLCVAFLRGWRPPGLAAGGR